MSTCWKNSSAIGSGSPSVTLCDRTEVRIQGQFCTAWLVTRRHCAVCRRELMYIPRNHIRQNIVEFRRTPFRGSGNAARAVDGVKMRSSTPTTAPSRKKNVSAVMQIRSTLHSIALRAKQSTNASSATYVNSTKFCLVCLETWARQAQCPFIASQPRQGFATQREKNVKNLPRKVRIEYTSGQASQIKNSNMTCACTTNRRAENQTSARVCGKWTVQEPEVEEAQTVSFAKIDL